MTAHATHRAHANSAASLAETDRSSRDAKVLLRYYLAPQGLTDRDVATQLGFGRDLNAVRPSITTMVEAGSLRETGKVRCPVTGRGVRLCKWVPPEKRQVLIRRTARDIARARAERGLVALAAGDLAAVRRHLERIAGL